MASLASINVKFNVDLSDFSSQMQNSLRGIDKWGQKLQSVGRNLTAAVTLPVAAAGAAAVKMASDYEESVNKVDTAFKTASPVVKEFAKTTLEASGIAEGTALDMSANFGDMATSMGLPVTAAAKMSTSLVALAGDLASFKNIGIDQANTALNGIFTGETESLKMLGVVMTEANLQQYAYSQGIKEKVKDLDQAAKVQLRYNYILSVTKNAQGDFARTQGGAANQTRIFTESLKQVGQQIGSIILPLFTKMITAVNSGIKSFSNLSEGTKTVIVVVAGLAAAIGPLLFSIGVLMSTAPLFVSGFAAISTAIAAVTGAFSAMSAAMLANPIAAVALVIGAAAVSALLFSDNAKKAATETKKMNEVQQQAVKINQEASASIVAQRAELQSYIDIAKNETKSKKERLAAIREINKISPEFLGNINLENIGTDKAREAVEKYNAALLAGAKARAAQTILQDLYQKQIELQLKREKGDQLATKLQADLTKGQVQSATAQQHQNDLIKQAAVERAAEDKVLQNQIKSAEAIYESGKKYTDLVKTDTGTASVVSKTGEDVKKYAPGTIAFYEKQIEALQKQQKEVALTSESYKKYGDEILAVQKKIDKISTKKKDFTFAFKEDFSVDNKIDNTITAPDLSKTDFSKGIQEAGYNVEGLTERLMYLQEVGRQVGASVAESFNVLSTGIIGSLGLASTGFEGFVAGMIQTTTKLLAMLLAECVALAIKNASISAAFVGPGAVFAQPAFIATAVGGILAAFAAIPKFETGGIVGGHSLYGDKILARVNSKEMIANTDQQRKIWGAMNASSGGIVTMIPDLKIKGSDLLLVFNRANDRKNRIG